MFGALNGGSSTNFTANVFESAFSENYVNAGDALTIEDYDGITTVSDEVEITLRYDPENAITGTWEVYV